MPRIGELTAIARMRDELSGKLTALQARAKSAGSGISGGLAAVKGGALVAVAAIGAFAGAIRRAAAAGATLVEKSRTIGVSVEAYQELGRVFEADGISAQQFEKATINLAKNVENAGHGLSTYTRALEAVGLSYEDLRGKTPDEQLAIFGEALKNTEDHGVRTAAAADLLGARNVALVPVLARGSAELAKQREKFAELGVVTEEEAKNLKELEQRFQNMGTQAKVAGQKLAAFFVQHKGGATGARVVSARWAQQNIETAKTLEELTREYEAGREEIELYREATNDFSLSMQHLEERTERVKAAFEALFPTVDQSLEAVTARAVEASLEIQRNLEVEIPEAFERAFDPERARTLAQGAADAMNEGMLDAPGAPPQRIPPEFQQSFQSMMNETTSIIATGLDLAGQRGAANFINRISSMVSTALSLLNKLTNLSLPGIGGGAGAAGAGAGAAGLGAVGAAAGAAALTAGAYGVGRAAIGLVNPQGRYDATSTAARFPGAGRGGPIIVQIDGREVARATAEHLPNLADEGGW